MRPLIFILFICMLQAPSVKGQELVYSSTAFVHNDYSASSFSTLPLGKPGECRATRNGRIALIVGGSEIVVGAGLFVASGVFSPNANQQNANSNNDFVLYFAGGLFMFSGAVTVLYGACEFIGGKIHDSRSGRRYSIISSKNGLGLAYNF